MSVQKNHTVAIGGFFCVYISFRFAATENTDYEAGNQVIISGWGSTRAANDNRVPHDASSTLQVAKVRLIADNTCKQWKYYGSQISYSMICAGKLGEGGVDSCQG